ncbi:hypothetical protein F5Y00DRAFT_271366 [Daldinia vernicosa]|uniref:uncharacterized protein n=1 Tax=Daldinia vernicosa TaxID=114800 RepID=UPI0020072FEE|nr:uncharacterized protein F5Y00DRAFT_271366 [Daldinia vernicosa]KAI0847044.1 hypothetical protein F5Y00DRAFT_271366 [Daldinia vernicosa]
MEPPSKRPKLGQAPYDDDDDDEANLDELSMSPTQFDARQDPLYELDKGRAKAATRLKSAFERIFEKYGRDFTGVGDEIDLETGEVIVNNGHLLSLEDEKDRAREGSVLSNEEEGIMKEKDNRPVEDSGSKSSLPTKPSMHSPSPGLHPGLNQPIMPGEFNHQLYPGMQLHPFGPPDPFMFGPPMFASTSVDPLWQSPELPQPLYQDRFGFIGQPVGYHNQLGYGPSIAPGGYNGGFLGPPFHHQLPKKVSHAKTTGRKILPHPTLATNDSDEDDILLGGNTQEIAKIATTEKNKSSPLASVTKKPKQTGRKDTKVDSETVTEQASHTLQKSQRRRPKKVAVPVEQPCSNTKVISPPPSSEKEPTVVEQKTEKLAQIEVLIRAMRPSDVHGKSSRSRKQIDSYGQMSKTKSRQGSETVDLSNSLQDVALETSDPSPRVDEPKEHAESDTPQRGEVMQPTINEDLKEVIDRLADITAPDEESHEDELLVGHEDTSNNENVEIEVADLPSNLDNSGEAEPLSSNNEMDTIVMEIPTDSKTPPLSEPTSPGSYSNKEQVLDNPQNLDLNANSDDREANAESSAIGNTNCAVETISYDLMSDEIQDTPIKAQEVNLAQDSPREATPSLPAATEPEESATRLPDPIQEAIQPLSSPTSELELPLDHAIIQPDSTEQDPDQPYSHREEEVIPLPTPEPEPAISPPRQVSPPTETSELVLRPLPSQSEQSKEVDPTDVLMNLPKNPSSSSTQQPASKTTTPSTPKKRSKASPALAKTSSSSHRTPSTRSRNRALTSLIPDDPDQDDDELSVLSSSVTTSPFITRPDRNIIITTTTPHHHPRDSSSTPRKSNHHHRHGFLTSSSTHHTPHHRTNSKRAAPPATDSRAFRGTKRRFMASSPVAAQSSPLARTVVNADDSISISVLASTPSSRRVRIGGRGGGGGPSVMLESSSSPVRTPGGSARRCGEDGFVCDRDFCFTCCK